jgi:hypothetical protein
MTAEVDMRTIQRALTLVVCLLSGAAFAAEGIAFITNVKGEATLDSGARAMLLGELAKGQRLKVGKDSLASVMYVASGKEYVLTGPGEYEVKDTEVAAASGMPPVTRGTEWRASSKVLVQVTQTSAASMRMRSIPAQKPVAAERLIFPTQGNIASLQPTFRWAAPDAKAEFTLSVVGQEKPVHQAKAAGNSYRVPAKLKPDTEYLWVVGTAAGEVGTGKFRTLPSETVQRVEKRRPSDKAEFSDRLLFALLLQEVGAVQEAQEAWGKLAQERSDLPELAAIAR